MFTSKDKYFYKLLKICCQNTDSIYVFNFFYLIL